MSGKRSVPGCPARWTGEVVLMLGLVVPAIAFAQATPRLPTPLPVPPVSKEAPKAAESAQGRPAIPAAKTGETTEPQGSRDPFHPLVEPSEGQAGIKQVTSLKLVGIMWDVSDRARVRALVETPDGLGYYLRVNEERFGGKVIAIEPNAIKFSVQEQDPGGKPRVGTVELKLRSE